MINRCHKPWTTGYERWGGRGICVCDRWRHSFINFRSDMGDRPAGASLDRIDNSGGYEPGNCRWSTSAEQARNRRVRSDGKLTPLTASIIRSAYSSSGFTQKQFARWFGVSTNSISLIIRGITWRAQ